MYMGNSGCHHSHQKGDFLNAVGLAGHGVIAPLLVEMLQSIRTELQRYERLINYWPVHAPMLEEAVCTMLRAVTVSVTRHCGLLPAKREVMPASSYSWNSAGYAIQKPEDRITLTVGYVI